MLIEWIHNLWLRLKAAVKRRQLDRDLAEELEFHLAMREQKLIAEGMEPRAARYAARRGFGNAVLLKETSGDLWSFPSLESLFQDVRYGLRQLRRSPGFTALAILTLALGIGGTTAIFSVVYGAVLDPGPYADSGRLAVLVTHGRNQRFDSWARVSASEFLDYREQNHVFDEVIGGAEAGVLLTGNGPPEYFDGRAITPNLFRVLGVPPLMGRPITPEDAKPGAPPVVVLSYKVWQSKFGGDPGIVGGTIVLNHQPTTVVGVMPPRFGWCWDACLQASLSHAKTPDPAQPFLVVEGHLKPGVTMEQAAAEMGVLAKRLATLYPKEHPKGVTFALKPLAWAGRDPRHRLTLYILLGAVGFLLLISCVNIANLLLARANGRGREVAVRAALGASRARLVRQFLIESLLLALGGAVLGCLVAWNLLGGLVALIPPGYLDFEAVVQINGPVLVFTLGVTLLSTLLFGLAPALHAVSGNLQGPLKASGRAAGESRRHHMLRNLQVVSEVTLSLVLLTGAGLLLRSFWALRHIELGYSIANVLQAGAALPEERYKTAEARKQFDVESLGRLRALPGVASAALAWPTINYAFLTPIEIPGRPRAENQRANLRFASDGFFETMGIQTLQGRTISEEDFRDARKVAVVSQTFAFRYFGNENPLGREIELKELYLGTYKIEQARFEVVGVVADTVHDDGTEPRVQPTLFIPYTVGGIPWNIFFVRTAGQPGSLANSIRREFASLDKELVVEVGPAGDDLQYWYTEPRFVLGMLIGFAALGVTLVCIGVYSVLSYTVSQRTHEIGLRIALGAEAGDVRRLVLKSGLRWLLVGIGIGVPASIALAKILQNRIWGIKPADPSTLIAVSLVLTAVGLAACYLPARRATKVDPLVALRCE